MDLNTLARQLVEHPRWTWQPGMFSAADMQGRVYAFGDYDPRFPQAPRWHQMSGRILRDGGTRPALRPNLDHPTTKGWLLHMLREATGTQDACASWLGGEWRLYGWIGASALGRFPTEGAALAAALLAVWNGGAS